MGVLRYISIGLLMLFLASCDPMGKEELKSSTPVLTALLQADSFAKEIQLFHLSENSSAPVPIEDAEVSIEVDGTSYPLHFNGFNYESNSLQIAPHSNYIIKGNADNQAFETTVHTPPAITASNYNDTLYIDAGNIGIISVLTWTALNTDLYSYVLRLEPLDSNLVTIPFTGGNGGQFEQNNSGPQVEAGIILLNRDFKYYGKHRLTVFAIPRNLEFLYFYISGDIRGLLANGPDNVQGIKGFAGGMTSCVFELDILPQ